MPLPRQRRTRVNLLVHAHPFELALGFALVINGLRGVLGDYSPSVGDLPAPALVLYLVVTVIGGLGTIIGLWLADDITVTVNDPGKIIERASLWLVSASYAGFAVLVVYANGTAGLAAGLTAIVIAAACIFRTRAIRRAQRVILEQIQAQNHPEATP